MFVHNKFIFCNVYLLVLIPIMIFEKKYNDFLHHEHFITAILLQPS